MYLTKLSIGRFLSFFFDLPKDWSVEGVIDISQKVIVILVP